MRPKKILGIEIQNLTKKEILEQIKKNITSYSNFLHIISLNPENMVISTENENFKKVIETSSIRIIDGVGVYLAAKFLRVDIGERITGVDLMKNLISLASEMRLRVVLMGGKGNLANDLAKCYQEKYPKAHFFGFEGIKDKNNSKEKEIDAINSIVLDIKPNLVFIALGSPYQELWIDQHKSLFSHSIVMGVGGAFDYLSGNVKRANTLIQNLGLEWGYRLITQPWRWKRQLRLIVFIYLVIKEKLAYATMPLWKKTS